MTICWAAIQPGRIEVRLFARPDFFTDLVQLAQLSTLLSGGSDVRFQFRFNLLAQLPGAVSELSLSDGMIHHKRQQFKGLFGLTLAMPEGGDADKHAQGERRGLRFQRGDQSLQIVRDGFGRLTERTGHLAQTIQRVDTANQIADFFPASQAPLQEPLGVLVVTGATSARLVSTIAAPRRSSILVWMVRLSSYRYLARS